MNLLEKIEQDFIEAMKNKNETAVSTLRMLKSALINKEIVLKKELSEDDIITSVQKEIKSRRDSIDAYETGGRPELADKEKKEIPFLEKYLPKQMAEHEIRAEIEKIISQSGAKQISDMGKVMGQAMSALKGKADGQLVSKIVKELLKG